MFAFMSGGLKTLTQSIMIPAKTDEPIKMPFGG